MSDMGWPNATSTRSRATSSVQPTTPPACVPSGSGGRSNRSISSLTKSQCSWSIIDWIWPTSGGTVAAVHVERLLRHHDVDAVRLAVEVLVHPGELDLELLGAQAHRAQHAEPAGPADRHRDVAAVGEREDRVLDADGVTQSGMHGVAPPTPTAAGIATNPTLIVRPVIHRRSDGER